MIAMPACDWFCVIGLILGFVVIVGGLYRLVSVEIEYQKWIRKQDK